MPGTYAFFFSSTITPATLLTGTPSPSTRPSPSQHDNDTPNQRPRAADRDEPETAGAPKAKRRKTNSTTEDPAASFTEEERSRVIPALVLLAPNTRDVSKVALLDMSGAHAALGDIPLPPQPLQGKKPRSDTQFNRAYDSSGLPLLSLSITRLHGLSLPTLLDRRHMRGSWMGWASGRTSRAWWCVAPSSVAARSGWGACSGPPRGGGRARAHLPAVLDPRGA